jgi:hypothetical protein
MNLSEILTTTHASLLIPFDIGKSYVLRPTAGTCIEDEWKQAFTGFPSWDWAQFPETFRNPLGCLARLKLYPWEPGDHSLGDCRALQDVQNACEGLKQNFFSTVPWAKAETAKITAFLFPLGIGVLVAQLDLKRASRGAAIEHYSKRDEIKESLGSLIVGCSDYYAFCLKEAATRKTGKPPRVSLTRLDVDRVVGIKESAFLFPLFFAEDHDYDFMTAGYQNRLGGNGLRHTYDGAEIYVAWTEAYIKKYSRKAKMAVERNFVIALASWFALFAMDRFAVSRSQEAFADPRTLQAKRIRMMRLVHMDVANASHPIRWTAVEKDLLLLDKLHLVWDSKRLWQNVEGRAALLESHYTALEAEESESRAGRLTLLGLLIAGITTTSVIADLASLAKEGWFFDHGFSITLSVLLLLILAGVGVYARHRASKSPSPEG